MLQRRYFRPANKAAGLQSDHAVVLTAMESAKAYPEALRRVSYVDPETNQRFPTNNFALPALTIAQIYKCCWQVELWIKQHLRIKAFFGTSKNAVTTRIWIAVSFASAPGGGGEPLTLFEKVPILLALQAPDRITGSRQPVDSVRALAEQ
jgi:hypothetical protein